MRMQCSIKRNVFKCLRKKRIWGALLTNLLSRATFLFPLYILIFCGFWIWTIFSSFLLVSIYSIHKRRKCESACGIMWVCTDWQKNAKDERNSAIYVNTTPFLKSNTFLFYKRTDKNENGTLFKIEIMIRIEEKFKSFKWLIMGIGFWRPKKLFVWLFSYEYHHNMRFVNIAAKSKSSPHKFNLISPLCFLGISYPRPKDETFTRHLADMTYHHLHYT